MRQFGVPRALAANDNAVRLIVATAGRSRHGASTYANGRMTMRSDNARYSACE
jgi:hypothetical protein